MGFWVKTTAARLKSLALLASFLSASVFPCCRNAALAAEPAIEAAKSASEKSSAAPASTDRKPFTSGSDFKTGPVTDDQKLIKPIAKDTKNQPNSSSHTKNDTPAEMDDADQRNSSKTGPVTDDAKLIKPVTEDKGSAQPNPPKNADVSINNKGPISLGAVKVAKDLEMLNLIAELNDLKRDGLYVPGQRVHRLEVISVRQDLDETLFSAFLATRRVVSELDRQVSGYDAVARVLEEKRDQTVRNNNILNFTSGGALASTQGGISVGTKMKYQNAGNELCAIAGALSAVLGAYTIKLQGGAKRDAEREPNMLAPIFGLKPVEPNKYPPLVWNYINDHEPGQKKNRREQLIDRWIKLNYIESLEKPTSPHHLAALAGTIPLHKEITIDLLRDRIPMLEDVRAAVAGINEYLDEILTFVRQP